MNPITVLLAEDHQVVREGFRSLLQRESDLRVVGEAATGREAVQLTRKLRPAVVVMDIAMPQLNGLEAARQIRKAFPGVKVLVLSAYRDDIYVEEAAALGVAGFLLKQTSSHELATAIREVHKGNPFFSPAVAGRFGGRGQKPAGRAEAPGKRHNRLSPREIEVLQLIAEGKRNKQIAEDLGLTFKTVDKHRQHLMAKLDIHDPAGLTRYAISAGIIESRVRVTIT